jgi:uncharacterized protein YcfJ
MKKILFATTLAFALTAAAPEVSAQEVKTTTKTKTASSRKKKGAIIGGVAGAATGVAVSKNNSKGAIIGGAVGAGTGYMLGRRADKKKPYRKTVTKTKTTVQ